MLVTHPGFLNRMILRKTSLAIQKSSALVDYNVGWATGTLQIAFAAILNS